MKSPREIVQACRLLFNSPGINRSQQAILRKASDEIARIFELNEK